MVVRPYNEELQYLEKKSPYKWEIKKGFQPNMKVGITIYLKMLGSYKKFCFYFIG